MPSARLCACAAALLSLAVAGAALAQEGAAVSPPAAGAALARQPAATPRLGQPLTSAENARAGLTVYPDGRGLPPGSGTVAEGVRLYESRCARCHGVQGSGGSGGKLVGRTPLAEEPSPHRTIGQYWPHATTLFDYIRRAMPLERPGTLADDEVYALTAWLLFANGIIAADQAMDARSLPAVRMPNGEGFVRAEEASR